MRPTGSRPMMIVKERHTSRVCHVDHVEGRVMAAVLTLSILTHQHRIGWAGVVPMRWIQILERPVRRFGRPSVCSQVKDITSPSISSTPQLMSSGGDTRVIDYNLPVLRHVSYWFNVEKP